MDRIAPNSPDVVWQLRLKWPAVWLLLLLVPAVLLPDRVWNILLVGLGGLFGVAFFWARSLTKGLQGQRQLQFGWVGVGDRLVESFRVENRGWLPALWITVQDQSNVPGYSAAVVQSLTSGRVEWQQEAICYQRGEFQLGPWQLVSGDPFGIFRVVHAYPPTEKIIIHPPIHSELPIPLPAGQSHGRSHVRERSWQATINSAGIRPYQTNDPYHWIHWRSSAHRDALQVRQFDLDVAGDLWILLDMEALQQLEVGSKGTEEHAIILASTFAGTALRQNRAVGLACYGQIPRLVSPGRGQGQQWAILRALALAKADGQTSLAVGLQDVGRFLRREMALLVITANGHADWLPAAARLPQRGVPCTTILLDRVSFGGDGNSHALRELVRQVVGDCYVVAQGEVGVPAFAREKEGFWSFKITPSGKAIVVKTPGK